MKHLRFTNLDDLFAFAVHCARGGALGRGGRAGYDQVWLAKDSFAFAYAPPEWDESGQRFGGQVREGSPEGQPWRLNDVLLCLHLRARPPQASLAVPALVVAVPAASGQPDAELQRALHEAARAVPRREGAVTQFYFRTTADRLACCHAALISEVDTGFDLEKFRRQHPAPVKVFVPAWDHAECYLFVEWGYAYPKPVEFSQLYDFSAATDTGGRHLVLATAGAAVTVPHATSGRTETWFQPRWHLVGAESWHTIETVVQAQFGQPPEVRALPVEAAAEAVPLTVEIGRVSDAVGSRGEIATRISQHERELERLYQRRERLGDLERRDYRAVFLWRQPDQADGPRLPAALEEFLQKPLAELARYTYARVAAAGGCHHYVATEMHLPASRALAVACDQIYLCDARWADWGLPLYVRSDCSLSIAIEEFDLAAKVRELLAAAGVASDAPIILAEPAPPPLTPDPSPLTPSAAPGLHALQFTTLVTPTPLSEALRLLNAHAAGPPSVAQLAGARADGAVIPHDIQTSAAAADLDRVLVERATALVAASEVAWEQLRLRLQTTALDAQITNLLLNLTEECYRPAAESWKAFVNAVVANDERIAHLKLTEQAAWVQTEPERQGRLEKIRQAQANEDEAIKAREAEYDQLLPGLEAANQRLAKQLDDLAAARGKLDAARKAGEEKIAQLKAANTELERAHKEQEARLTEARKQLSAAEAQEARLAARRRELTQSEQELEERTARCQVASRDLPARLSALGDTARRALVFVQANEPARVVIPSKPGKKRSFLARLFGWRRRDKNPEP